MIIMKVSTILTSSTYIRPLLLNVKFYSNTRTSAWQQPAGTDTGISIYNGVLKKKVPLILKDNIATWYSCGPTVYDSAHIGHASSYVKLDIIQRILLNYFNIDVITSMGITDIDDKIIKKSVACGEDWKTISKKYEEEFWKDMSSLNILQPDIVSRVTDNIPTITNFIAEIVKNNNGYKASDNSVYFDTESYGKYGKFINVQSSDEQNKDSPKKSTNDFALWKAYKEGEPYWETAWGKGRPGWHIECSAMVSKLFGDSVDFHAGGIDLKFPHHENEEAQSCAFHKNEQWVNYWIHTGYLHLKNDVKMSKSLKNTISIEELLKNYDANSFRMACLMSHYRNIMEFNNDLINMAKTIVGKFSFFIEDCNDYINKNNTFLSINDETKLMQILNETKISIDQSLRDDFDTSKCVTHILRLMKETNNIIKSERNQEIVSYTANRPNAVVLISNYVKKMSHTFGFQYQNSKLDSRNDLSDVVDILVKLRQMARTSALSSKDKMLLKQCDEVRDNLKNRNIVINDKPNAQSSWIFNK